MPNPNLAFEPRTKDKDLSLTLPEMLGLSPERVAELEDIVSRAWDDKPAHCEGLSALSKEAETPQELMLLGIIYYRAMHEDRDEGPSALKNLLQALKSDTETRVHVIKL